MATVCSGCVQRIDIPGNCHIGCADRSAFPVLRRWPRCGEFPIAFDAGIVERCPNWTSDVLKRIEPVQGSLLELVRLLWR